MPISCRFRVIISQLLTLLLCSLLISPTLSSPQRSSTATYQTYGNSFTNDRVGVARAPDTTADEACQRTEIPATKFDQPDVFFNALLNDLQQRYAHQPTFVQAVSEMAFSIQDLLLESPYNPDAALYRKAFALLTEPERTIGFRVSWMDDHGQLQHNRAWRVEFSSALGPYKGGLRFHPSVDEGILKFLGFEQIFKNALTGLPLGGGKGGSDFDPKGKSDGEVRRFCQAFMEELHRYIHPSTDVPAGDIGVGGREIGYLYGAYKRLTNRHGDGGVLTGKSLILGGSPLRPEATGYGLVYMAQIAVAHATTNLPHSGDRVSSLQGLRCALSGSGNVAQYAAEKLLQLGAIVVTLSDSNGVLVFDQGMTPEDYSAIMECKTIHRGRLSSLQGRVSGRYIAGATPWNLLGSDAVAFDLALPCATQNEIDGPAAQRMVEASIQGVLEGANLPTTLEAQHVLRQARVLYIPGKASNAGGVGVSGLEMSQNAQRVTWTATQVDAQLQDMMALIYHQMVQEQQRAAVLSKACTLEQGANRAGFIKVAKAMKELGFLY